MASDDAVVPGIVPRDWDVDAFFVDEFDAAAQNPRTRCRLSRFSVAEGPEGRPAPGPETAVVWAGNPLEDPAVARVLEPAEGNDDANRDWAYWAYAPPILRAAPPDHPKVAIFFGPPGPVMNRQGLRAFAERADRVLVVVGGSERTPRFGVGVSPAILDALVSQALGRALPPGAFRLDVLAGYSTGFRGMNSTINSIFEPAHLGSVSRVVYFDCLYSHDEPPPGENTFHALDRVLKASPQAKIVIYEITGDTRPYPVGGTPRKPSGEYFTRWPRGADPHAPGGSAVTSVYDLKPFSAQLLSLSLARLVQGGLADGFFDRDFLASSFGADGAALVKLVDEHLKPRGSYTASRALAKRSGATFVGDFVGPLDAHRFSALATQMKTPVLDNPAFALLGWVNLPSMGDFAHDTHVPELGWEQLG